MEITRKHKWEEKQLYGCFKRLTSDISHKKKGSLKRETSSQNNAISTNYIKARIDKTKKTADVRYVVIKLKRSLT